MEYIFLFIAGYGLRIVKTRMNGEQLHCVRYIPMLSNLTPSFIACHLPIKRYSFRFVSFEDPIPPTSMHPIDPDMCRKPFFALSPNILFA